MNRTELQSIELISLLIFLTVVIIAARLPKKVADKLGKKLDIALMVYAILEYILILVIEFSLIFTFN